MKPLLATSRLRLNETQARNQQQAEEAGLGYSLVLSLALKSLSADYGLDCRPRSVSQTVGQFRIHVAVLCTPHETRKHLLTESG